ncbi:MAG TPA: presenilin family intramembrane aspartyl protease [archaeon]|nr:presenilin family intramembrane aspartyl protease [archaeon]
MKHSIKVTILLVLFYFLAQIIGLGFVYSDIRVATVITETGQNITVVSHPETALGPRPDLYNLDAIFMVLIGVLIGTGLVLIIVKFNKVNIWRGFFFFAVFMTITLSVGVFFNWYVAAVIGFLLAFLKMWKRNVVIHNLTELLAYSGIAVLFAPLFEPLWMVILLLVISVYDMFAVWQSKHMVKMAEFQIESDVFAGLSIPYRTVRSKSNHPKHKNQNSKQVTGQNTAILGGGDVAFPLIFAAVVMESFIKSGIFGPVALIKALPIPIITAIVLLVLLVFGKKGRYYPAMPFLTAGCLIGYFISVFL